MAANTLSTKRLISLNLTLDMLLNRQEKPWGCFQVIKEGDFYTLQIPTVSNLKLFANPQSIGYKGYWREAFSDRLPDIKDRSEKPDIYTRKKTKKVEVSISNPLPKNDSTETIAKEQSQPEKTHKKKISNKAIKLKPKKSKIIKLKHDLDSDINVANIQEEEQKEVEIATPTKELQLINPSRISRPKTIQKKQTIFEVIYRYSNCPEINFLNKVITAAIRDRIQSNATFDSMTEIMPLVLVKSADE